jgi:phage/conjugal plasmid C-4 type zinc finger protein, traR family
MTDFIDRACDLEEMQRAHALARQADRAAQNYPSAYECEECGEPIPEARRQAVPGCRLCIDCQREQEKYGKTSFTAR